MSEIDSLYQAACRGDQQALAAWMGRVERPIRLSLESYARAVDVEGIVQETLFLMLLRARDGGRQLTGEDASLKFAIGMARKLAKSQARKLGREIYLPTEDLPEPQAILDPPSDPLLARAIRECFAKLTRQPRRALQAQILHDSDLDGRRIAKRVGMTANTFWQNIKRARRQLADCLRDKGVPLEEILS